MKMNDELKKILKAQTMAHFKVLSRNRYREAGENHEELSAKAEVRTKILPNENQTRHRLAQLAELHSTASPYSPGPNILFWTRRTGRSS
jgi:hypothetical protein